MPYFEPGTVVLHEMPHVDESGRTGAPIITDVKPMLVVEDGPDLTALFIPAGSPTILCQPVPRDRPKPWSPGEYEMVESTWARWNTVFLMRLGEWHATWVWWTPDWEFLGWYVNLQEPFVRWEHGFLVRDLQLDIVVAPDRTWRWKDVDDLERSVELGVISAPIASRIRTEADTVITKIETATDPFTDDRITWRPPPDWPSPHLPTHHAGQTITWPPASS